MKPEQHDDFDFDSDDPFEEEAQPQEQANETQATTYPKLDVELLLNDSQAPSEPPAEETPAETPIEEPPAQDLPERVTEDSPEEPQTPDAEDDFFDDDDAFEEGESTPAPKETPAPAKEEAAPAERDDASPAPAQKKKEKAPAPPKPRKEKKPRKPISKKTLLGLGIGAVVLALAAVLVVIFVFGLTPRERRAATHVATMMSQAHNLQELSLVGDVITISIDDHFGPATFVFIPYRIQSPLGFRQRATAIFWEGVFIGNYETLLGGAVADSEADLEELELQLIRARREFGSWGRRIEHAAQEGTAFEPNPNWVSSHSVSARRIAQRLELEWDES